jgi:hypothetical protein
LFKIATADFDAPFTDDLQTSASEHDLLSQFCMSERWVGDLANGVIRLGARALALHGSLSAECGLLSLMRCYDPADRPHILELFEQASTVSSHFCYSTTVAVAGGHRQPVFCTGQSSGLEQKQAGSMVGIFIFPHFQLQPAAQLQSRRQA